MEGGGDGAWGFTELFARFAEAEGFCCFDFEFRVFGEGFEVGVFREGLGAELAGLVGEFLQGFPHFFPGELLLFFGEVELNEAHFSFFWRLEGGFALFVGFFDFVVRDRDVFGVVVSCESDDGGLDLLMVFGVGLHEFGFGGLGGGAEQIFDAVYPNAVADEFFEVFFGHPARSEGHLHVEFVAIVVELPLVLECRKFLDGFEDLFFGGVDAELVGFLTEDDGIPDEGIGAVLGGISSWGQRDEEFEHSEDAAKFEVASEAEVFERGDVATCDAADVIGAEFVHSGAWAAVEDDEGDDDDDGEGGEEGFLEAPEKVNHMGET